MRDQFDRLAREYPLNPPWRDAAFPGSPLISLLSTELPSAVQAAVPDLASGFDIQGSAGEGGWTHTPWVAFLDPTVTETLQEGFYVVYLLSLGCDRLYLSLNQGCTALKNGPGGIRGAREELRRRAEAMWLRAKAQSRRLKPISMNLGVAPTVWRGKLYEVGIVAGVEYDTKSLPPEHEMVADLREALRLYSLINELGGWDADDEISRDASADQVAGGLAQAKIYRIHRSIERQPGHSKKVKKAQGTRCKGCELELSEVYGASAQGIIDAHHLTPLASLLDGETVAFDPHVDFAVLCPNCHRVIHRFADPSDLPALKGLVAAGKLAKIDRP
jgi:5-methylcytosine-specific restriction enzyme A